MGDRTGIRWTNATWNPIVGCSVVSPGCTNCYAMRMANRLERMGVERYQGTTTLVNKQPVWTGKITLARGALEQPLREMRPRLIFVNSMSDLFHESVHDEWIDREWPPGTHVDNPTGEPSLNGRIALLRDAKGGEPAEWPPDLRLRQWPKDGSR